MEVKIKPKLSKMLHMGTQAHTSTRERQLAAFKASFQKHGSLHIRPCKEDANGHWMSGLMVVTTLTCREMLKKAGLLGHVVVLNKMRFLFYAKKE